MPTCKKCGILFPNHVKINGEPHNLQTRKFCLECSPFGKHNTRNIIRNTDLLGTKFCKGCDTIKLIADFYNNNKNSHHTLCKECFNKSAVEDQRNRKRKCLNYKGDKCVICGYHKCVGSLSFHHLDPTQKDFRLSRWTGGSFSEKIKKELDKCVLLCSNCHGEVHAGITELPVGLKPT